MKRMTFLGIVLSIIVLAGVAYGNGGIPVEIDIKPGSFPNSINRDGVGLIPVAILTTDEFDATFVDPSTVVFGPAQTREAHGKGHDEDVDGDGDIDLVFHFFTQSGLRCIDTEAVLSGVTYSGEPIQGVDSVNIICN